MKNIVFSIFKFSAALICSYSYGQEPEIKYDTTHLNLIKEEQNSTILPLGKQDFKENIKALKNTFSVPILANNITYQYTKSYLKKKWIGKVIGLSSYYFPLFEAKLAQYGLPDEIKYLAIVESALNPRAGSPMGASGLWQFMPETGGSFGLKSNKYINIFYDPVANTDCAMRFLQQLYEKFDDWLLAISAYNCGAGNVNKAIKKAKSKEYWKVRPFLPKETQAYVPTFLAVCYTFTYYNQYNIQPPQFKYKFTDFETIKVEKGILLETLIKQHKTPYNIFKFANPQILSEYIPEGSIIYILTP